LAGEPSKEVLSCLWSRGAARQMSASQSGGVRGSVKALALAVALSFPPGPAVAQAAGNPNLNAQLLIAAREGDAARVDRVLAQGAAPDARNRVGKTSLWISSERGRLDLVERLLAAGADPNLAALDGVTPLMAASYSGHAV